MLSVWGDWSTGVRGGNVLNLFLIISNSLFDIAFLSSVWLAGCRLSVVIPIHCTSTCV